tara:strand:+ start:5892 stop:6044 length:153 start_codon:yes stop_codon:yes gene_type:complete
MNSGPLFTRLVLSAPQADAILIIAATLIATSISRRAQHHAPELLAERIAI